MFGFPQSEIEKLLVQNEAEEFYKAFGWANLFLKLTIEMASQSPQIPNADFPIFSRNSYRRSAFFWRSDFLGVANYWAWPWTGVAKKEAMGLGAWTGNGARLLSWHLSVSLENRVWGLRV